MKTVPELALGAAPVCSLVALLIWMVRRSESRVSEVTDRFFRHLQASREDSVRRHILDNQLHQEYQSGLRANTAAIERLTTSLDSKHAFARPAGEP